MKLLIVDDNPAIRKHICGVMDIEMEGMDGITATRTILQSYPDARIIIVTTFDDPRLRSAARAAGARDYVLKQNVMELVKMVRK
jgi:DNA-binding NarL/FixJ family response regulator